VLLQKFLPHLTPFRLLRSAALREPSRRRSAIPSVAATWIAYDT
jgi:hypothetical protein